MSILKAVRGTRDLLPPETELWNRIEATARASLPATTSARSAPRSSKTPSCSPAASAKRPTSSRKRCTPGRTAPARSPKRRSLSPFVRRTPPAWSAPISSTGLGDTGLLQKLYYIGPQFRRERPQKGRYRQFFQIGAEVIGPPSAGSESPLRDAEVLEMLATLPRRTRHHRLDDSRSIPSARQATARAMSRPCARHCAPWLRRCASTASAAPRPIRCACSTARSPKISRSSRRCPKIADYLDEASKAHFAAVCAALDACGVPYEISPRLVRGLDYYTRTTFEFQHGGPRRAKRPARAAAATTAYPK